MRRIVFAISKLFKMAADSLRFVSIIQYGTGYRPQRASYRGTARIYAARHAAACGALVMSIYHDTMQAQPPRSLGGISAMGAQYSRS